MIHQRTKASKIPKSVKEKVFERDEGKCIVCGAPVTVDNACCHFISRARMGLGIEENIISLCHIHHQMLDNGEYGREKIRKYLQSKYPDWDEKNLVYSKWKWTDTI